MSDITNVLIVFTGGGIGAACRYLTGAFIAMRWGSAFPFGTLTVNIIGSFLMGALMMGLIETRWALPESYRLLLTVGFLGGFTTFSSFSLETLALLLSHEPVAAFVNICINCAGGILAAFLGMTVVRAVL